MFGYTYDDEKIIIYNNIAYLLLIQTIPIFITLLYIIPAPWGKTKPTTTTNSTSSSSSSSSISLLKQVVLFGPSCSPKISWCIMEIPNIIWCIVCYYYSNNNSNNSTNNQRIPVSNQILLLLFCIHYIYRSIIYPYYMSKHTTSMPFIVVFIAFTFCTLNGYLQAQGLCRPYILLSNEWERSLQFQIGICIFIIGFIITIRSDRILRKLRDQSQQSQSHQSSIKTIKKYSIPYGEMFHYVSNPHYMGEIIEWIGYCIACNYSIASITFVIYTISNLIPRAITNHQWYIQHFHNQYIQLNRKAIIPFIL